RRAAAQHGVDNVGDREDEQGVAVLRRARDQFGGDAAAGAAARLDHELLAEIAAQVLRQDARRDVGGGARTEAVDDAHRPRRVGLSRRNGGQAKQRDGYGGDDPPDPHDPTSLGFAAVGSAAIVAQVSRSQRAQATLSSNSGYLAPAP